MKLLKVALGAVILSSLTMAAPVYAKVRQGVVTAMEPIKNRGEDVTDGTKKKRGLGMALGGMAGILVTGKIGGPAPIAAPAIQQGVGEAATHIGPAPASTHYMVTIKLDSGKVISLARYRLNLTGVSVGSRVSVDGTGNSAEITPIR